MLRNERPVEVSSGGLRLRRSGVDRQASSRGTALTDIAAEGRHLPTDGDRVVEVVGTVVIGAGPAGMAPLLAAARAGLLPDLLFGGLTLVERAPSIGSGRLGQYAITSDSAATTFLSCVTEHPVPALAALADHPTARAIAAYGTDAVPLPMVGAFLDAVSEVMAQLIEAAPRGRVLCGHEAVRIRRLPGGAWRVRLCRLEDGVEREILARQVVVATGAHQSASELGHTRVGGHVLPAIAGNRLVCSDEVLRTDGLPAILRRLDGIKRPRIVVVGGSTSAVSAVRVLLDALGDRLDDGGLVLAHRRDLKLFFVSAEQARRQGYHAFDDRDLCPVSGFVNRFGGLRYGSRATVAAALGVQGFADEPHLRLHRIDADGADEELGQLLQTADLVVSALGYRPCALPVFDEAGEALPLSVERGGAPMVGADCAVLDETGAPIANLYGIGLAAGYRPPVAMGGEPSFRGQVNGLWLWQNDVGLALVHRLLASTGAAAVRKVA